MTLDKVNPARAGMIPLAPADSASCARKPRASGDDPRARRQCEDNLQ